MGVDWIRLNCNGWDQIGLDWIGLDLSGLDQIGLDWIGFEWTGLDWIGLDWIESDWFGLDWIELGQVRSGQVTSDQIRSDQIKSDHVFQDDLYDLLMCICCTHHSLKLLVVVAHLDRLLQRFGTIFQLTLDQNLHYQPSAANLRHIMLSLFLPMPCKLALLRASESFLGFIILFNLISDDCAL